jgi:DNA-binding protein H-NS
MKLDTLDALQNTELQTVIARCEELLKARDAERKAKALIDARALLASAGLSMKDLTGKGRGKSAKGAVYKSGSSYQHPANKTLIWSAKGQKPNWLRDLEAEGRRPIEIEAAEGNSLQAVKKTG